MVDPVTISGLFNIGQSLIKRIWPDPAEQAKQLMELQKLEQDGDLARLQAHVQLLVGQMEINKAEARHKSIFVAGWRPFIGWVGGIALAYQFVLYPLLLWAMAWWFPDVKPPPILDTGALWTIITGMLGIAGMRTFDKTRGTQTDAI